MLAALLTTDQKFSFLLVSLLSGFTAVYFPYPETSASGLTCSRRGWRLERSIWETLRGRPWLSSISVVGMISGWRRP